MLARYRRTGADLPFTDPRRAHGVAFEGWYWRLTQPATRHVLVVLVGINRAPDGTWATVGVAEHPTGAKAATAVQQARVSADGRRIEAGDALRVRDGEVEIALGDVQARFAIVQRTEWRGALGGIGLAHAVPGLSQYWHPWLLHGRAHGTLTVDGQTVALDGAHAYAEKNWGGGGFPDRWWWGQAHGFAANERLTVAFAGGTAGLGRLRTTATSLVVHDGEQRQRVVQPLQRLRTDISPGRWLLRTPGGLEVEAHAGGADVYSLPVPLPRERRNLEDAAAQHLAGELRVRLPDGREDVSRLAGLEQGSATPCAPPAPAPRAR